jgi:hypothetical protein
MAARCSAERHLGHDQAPDLDYRDLLGAAPVPGVDLVWPGVPVACRLEDCRQLVGLGWVEWNGPANDL